MSASGPPAGTAPWPAWPAQGPPARPPRPATVRAAFVLMLVAAVLVLVQLVALGYDLAHFSDQVARAGARVSASANEINQLKIANQVTAAVTIALVVVAAAALIASALWMRRGSGVARVFACVASGVTTVCCCSGVALNLALQDSTGGGLAGEVTRLSQRETPAWVGATSIPAAVAPLLTGMALILLLLPASNRYFNPPPPTPFAAPTAGYPYGGGYYAYPSYGWGPGPVPAAEGPTQGQAQGPEADRPGAAPQRPPSESGPETHGPDQPA